MTTPVTIIMIEDDDGHARLIERNIRRSGVNNKIVPSPTVQKRCAICSARTAAARSARTTRF